MNKFKSKKNKGSQTITEIILKRHFPQKLTKLLITYFLNQMLGCSLNRAVNCNADDNQDSQHRN